MGAAMFKMGHVLPRPERTNRYMADILSRDNSDGLALTISSLARGVSRRCWWRPRTHRTRRLSSALNTLRPDVADFFTFVDVDERHHFWGTSNLVKFAEEL